MNTPQDIKKVVVVGGGSAGWMTALILANAMIKKGIEITLLESPMVGVIGVGEGSTPKMKGFFDDLGIEESEWMPECNGTYKCGITFENWSTKPGFVSYFHPFASMLDNLTMPIFVNNAQARVRGIDVHAHPNRFFIASRLADKNLAPKPDHNFPFEVSHGYHFDSMLLGKFLHRKGLELGIKYKTCHVLDAQLNDKGEIASVVTKEGETITADFFVDCTGFASLLSQKALGTPYVSFANNLINDSAIAMPTPMGDSIPSQTVSTAMKHGWKWQIPLTNRYGNGYVYSSAFCSPEEAERELRESLGLLDSDVEARHLKMKAGRVTKHWNKNCLAVGLAQGFIEPLEATTLMIIQRTAEIFVQAFEAGDLSEAARTKFNDQLNVQFEGTRDYIVTHYKTNSRTDTEYWRANAANNNISDALHTLYGMWMEGSEQLPNEIAKQNIGKHYPILSWYSIMAGMGIFPDEKKLRPPKSKDKAAEMIRIDNLLQRSALNYRDQKEVLMDIPKKSDPSLQVYFW